MWEYRQKRQQLAFAWSTRVGMINRGENRELFVDKKNICSENSIIENRKALACKTLMKTLARMDLRE